MKVEMIMGKICKNCDIKINGFDPSQFKAVRTDLKGTGFHAVFYHLRKR